jgi:DNA-binding LytR/AlgR family response regulator
MIPSLAITVASSTNALFTDVSRVIERAISAAVSLHQVYSVADAVYSITSRKSPLVILNHRLNDGEGFDVLNHFQFREGRDFAFIYVGNTNTHGLQEKALALGALAYLEMPIDSEALQQALQQFLFDYGISSQVSPTLLASALAAPEPPEYTSSAATAEQALQPPATEQPPTNEAPILAPDADEVIHLDIKREGKRTETLVRIDDILYCRAERNDLVVITVRASKDAIEHTAHNAADATSEQEGIYRTRATLKEYRQRLARYGFVLVERSHLVNLHHIRTVERNQVLLSNNQRLPVGGTYFNALRERFTQWVRAGGGQK